MRITKQYLEGCVTLCERRRQYLLRRLAKAKRRGDMREVSRVRRDIARNLEKKYRLEDMMSRKPTTGEEDTDGCNLG